jgi:threonine dehydratase
MPERPTLAEFEAAAERLKGVAVRTPLVPLHDYDASAAPDIFLKPETMQPVTSFKIRGVFNAVASLSDEERARGVSTQSAGNTSQALGWVARYFGVSARSIMPQSAPTSKVEASRAYGVTPVLLEAEPFWRYIQEAGWEGEPYAFIHPWTNRALMAGHGTIGLEIIADWPEVDTVYVPVGGGGLMGGVGSALKALKPSVRVVGVEPEGCPALHASFEAGEPVSVACSTMCDGVGVPFITEENYPLLREVVDEVALVPEKAVKAAIKRLALRNKIIVEGAGALSVAAALAAPADERGTAVCVVTGGSIDSDKLTAILNDSTLDDYGR